MIKDRLAELEDIWPDDNANQSEPTTTPETADPEVVEEFCESDWIMVDEATFVEPLIERYSAVRADLFEIQSNVEILNTMLEAKNADKFDDDEFSKIRYTNSQLSNKVMGKLKKLESKLPKEDDYRTKARMKRVLYYGYFQQYVLMRAKHEEVLQKYEQQVKKNLQRQSKILNYDLGEEEIDKLVANKQTNLLYENILTEAHSGRQNLQDLINLTSDLIKVENTISEAHDLFIRLQTLVMEQGDIVQRIERHFDDARDYVAKGQNELNLTEKGRNKNLYRNIILTGVATAFAVACSARR